MPPTDDRYSRQTIFPPIGKEGQARLREARVGLVGLGALGSTLAETLVRAGIGHLVAVDRDFIEPSNLHRQGLYIDDDAARRLPKAVAASRHLAAMNPEVVVDARPTDFNARTALELFADCDLLLDGTDSFETRYLLNDLAIHLDRPWVYGACVAAQGMTATIIPGETPCLACLFPEPPPPGTGDTCDTAGIIAPAAQMAAALQAAEALKLLVGDRENLRPGLLSFELWPFRLVEIGGREDGPRAGCFACQAREMRFLKGEGRAEAVSLCGRDAVQVAPAEATPLALDELAARIEAVTEILRRNEHLIVFSTEDVEVTVFKDGRAMVKGTTDAGRARSIYARFIGT